MKKMIKKWQSFIDILEPWWTLIGAPVVQEFIFRFIPYQIFIIYGRFYLVGIVSSTLFAMIHWYFGWWFVLYTFIGGLVAWFVMVNYGLLWVIILHSVANIILLKFRVLQKLKTNHD